MQRSRLATHFPRRRGYTLLDVTIAVFIMGILAAVAAPRFVNSLHRLRVNAAAERIAVDLKYARRQAKIRNGQETVSFDLDAHRYALSTAADLNRKSQVYTVTLSDYPYQSSLVSVDFGGDPAVTFNALGAPSDAGQVVVECGGFQKIVTVAADSGEVAIQ
jgi:type II secretory pathway pseudopilin PulG